MTRINAIRNIAGSRDSVAWGKDTNAKDATKTIASSALGSVHAYAFAALLIICSVTVGCSSDKPKPVSSNKPIPVAQPASAAPTPAPLMEAENKPAPKKPVVHKKPATVNYSDKMYGVTFEYPRRYAIETGDAATQLVASNPIPMNFVQPGGIALAAVELPETNYVNTDFSSAFFNVSVNKTVTADQCGEFAVPQGKQSSKSESPSTSPEAAPIADTKTDVAKSDTPKSTDSGADAKPSTEVASSLELVLKDMPLPATEAVSGEGTRQSDSKYFHVYQNGACYEFALNVTTDASEEGLVKHVDRDKVFSRLEQILSTVKISPVAAPEVATETPAPAPQAQPAQ
jgi:hypothetical protein